jgi:hypothetical protein
LSTATLTRADGGHVGRLLAFGLIDETEWSWGLDRRRYCVNRAAVEARAAEYGFLERASETRIRRQWDAHNRSLIQVGSKGPCRIEKGAPSEEDWRADFEWCATTIRVFVEALQADDPHGVSAA